MPQRPPSWIRRYPPMVSLAVALVITLLVLPSALTLPNANPSTVLEYAPIPPEDDEPPPPQEGAISQLGLGVSSSISTGVAPDIALPPQLDTPGGRGTKPITKRCVGRPLRQTEDPNSPPCVPYFEGDNGGATWQGVTKDEIVVLIYATGNVINVPDQNGDEAEQSPAAGTYCDVDAPPESDSRCLDQLSQNKDHREVTVARAYSKYFNDRFQTYDRHVHFYVFYSGSSSPAGRRADAADNYERLKPFATIDRAFFGGYNAVYAESMVRRNASVFGNFTALESAYYGKYAPFIWSFWPDVEHWAANYVTYVCTKVVPGGRAIHAGGSLSGRPRKYAFLSTSDPSYPGLQHFAKLAKPGLMECGVQAAEDVTFPRHQYVIDPNPDAVTAARENVAKMAGAGVTTVLWLGGFETEHSKAAAEQGWEPEWFVAGDLLHDTISNGRGQEQSTWSRAALVSNQIREDRSADSPCRQAFREGDPTARSIDEFNACDTYRALFQLFTSIQVAGPDLTPYSVDQGQHAIQRQSSPGPYVAACFYDPGDYTCVKDATEAWWDADAPDPDGRADLRGCWRLVREGKRYLAGEWEGTDRDVFVNPADPCTNVDSLGYLGGA